MSVRTLLVEDSASARGIIRQRLEAIGCQIVAMASDSATALELVRELHPQLVTLDLIMPETGSLNAEQLFRLIRKEMPEVAVVVISAQSKAALRADFLRQGAIEFFEKPFIDFDGKCCNFQNGDGGRPERNWAAKSQAARSNSWSMN